MLISKSKSSVVVLMLQELISVLLPLVTTDSCTGNLRILKPAPYEPVYPHEFLVLFVMRPPFKSGSVCITIDHKPIGYVQVNSSSAYDLKDSQYRWHPTEEQRKELHGFSLLTVVYATESACQAACCAGSAAVCAQCANAACQIEIELVRFRTRRFSGACRSSTGPPSPPPSMLNSSQPALSTGADRARAWEHDAALGKAGAPARLLQRWAAALRCPFRSPPGPAFRGADQGGAGRPRGSRRRIRVESASNGLDLTRSGPCRLESGRTGPGPHRPGSQPDRPPADPPPPPPIRVGPTAWPCPAGESRFMGMAPSLTAHPPSVATLTAAATDARRDPPSPPPPPPPSPPRPALPIAGILTLTAVTADRDRRDRRDRRSRPP